MKVRQTEYPDVALAGSLRSHLGKLPLPNVHQSAERVYIRYGSGGGQEYTAIYCLRNKKRFFELHLEDPIDSVFDALEKQLISEEAVAKRAGNKKYSSMFGPLRLKRSFVSYQEESGTKNIDSVAAITRIKEVPLGKKGHLSGDFSQYIFRYIIQPFLSIVEKHKIKSA